MTGKKAGQPGENPKPPVILEGMEAPGHSSGAVFAENGERNVNNIEKPRKNGGWREIEALREKAALRASLAEVWDEDFDLDDEILADMDHTAEFFTPQKDKEDELFDEDEDSDEFFEDDEV